MGPSAVLSMSTDRLPNELTLALRPGKANGTLFNVDMLTTGRKYEKSEDGSQYYDEIGRNVFETVAESRSISLKEVETITSYEATEDPDVIHARQRSMVYLVPAQDPTSTEFKMWKAAANRPIDVRDYSVIYRRKK